MPRNFEEYREQGMRIVEDYRRRQEPENLLGPKLFLSLIFGRVIEAFVDRVLIGPMQSYGKFGIDDTKRAKFYEELRDSESATHKRASELLQEHSSGAEVAHVAHWCGIATVCFSMPDRDFHVNVTEARLMEAVEMFQHLDAEFPATSSEVFHDVYRWRAQ